MGSIIHPGAGAGQISRGKAVLSVIPGATDEAGLVSRKNIRTFLFFILPESWPFY